MYRGLWSSPVQSLLLLRTPSRLCASESGGQTVWRWSSVAGGWKGWQSCLSWTAWRSINSITMTVICLCASCDAVEKILLCDQVILSYLCSRLMIQFAVLESSPVVGSSRNSKEGHVISSLPMLHLFLSPPDTPRRNSVPICAHKTLTYIHVFVSPSHFEPHTCPYLSVCTVSKTQVLYNTVYSAVFICGGVLLRVEAQVGAEQQILFHSEGAHQDIVL